jgi:hypothetical protein
MRQISGEHTNTHAQPNLNPGNRLRGGRPEARAEKARLRAQSYEKMKNWNSPISDRRDRSAENLVIASLILFFSSRT